jgi:hypothetical protein
MIHSTSEFEAVLGDVIITLDKIIFSRSTDVKLEKIRRDYKKIVKWIKKKLPPEPADLKAAAKASKSLRTQGFPDLDEKTFDIEDFMEFNPKLGFEHPPEEEDEA